MLLTELLFKKIGTTYHTPTKLIKVVSSFGEYDTALYIEDKLTGQSYILESEILLNEDIKLEDIIPVQSLKLSDPNLYRFIHPSLGDSLSFSTVKNTLNSLNKEKSVGEVLSILKSMHICGGNHANS